MQWTTSTRFTMADVVLDANIIVGSLDEHDSLHVRATALVNRLIDDGHGTVLVDFLVAEAISVICRRANERKTNPPDLAKALGRIREWRAADEIEYQGQHFERLLGVVLDIIEETGGRVGAKRLLGRVATRGSHRGRRFLRWSPRCCAGVASPFGVTRRSL